MLPNRLLLPVAIAITWVVWGSTYLAIRYAIADLPPLLMAAMRFTAASTLMLAWLKARGAPWPNRRQWRNAALVGFLMLAVGNGAVCVAEQWIGSGIAALLVAVAPLFTAVFGCFIQQRPKTREWLGILLGLGGVALLNFDASLSGEWPGVLLLLLAAATWAATALWLPRLDLPAGAMSPALQMLAASLSLWPLGWLAGERLPQAVSASAWAALAYLTVFGSIVAYSAYVYVLRRARPILASSYAYMNPLIALLLGAAIGGETLSLPIGAGMAVILLGVILLTSSRARKPA